MNWEKEQYVKVYLRDTPEFLAMSWQARALFFELLRKVDRRGIMQVGKHGVRGIAIAIHAPVEEIEAPIGELLEQGRLVWIAEDGHFVIPNHVRAQGAVDCDAMRKRKQRERERQGGHQPGACDPATSRASGDTNTSFVPSQTGHAASRVSGQVDTASSASVTGHAAPLMSEGADEASGGTETTSGGAMSRASGHVTDASGLSVTCHDQIRSDQIRLTRSDQMRSEGESALARVTRTLIDPECALSSEGRAYADTVGVTDVDRVHRDFKNHYLAEAKVSADWEAVWRRWCDRELRIQRQERDRNRPRAPLQVDPPDVERGWTMPEIIRLQRGKPS